MPRPPDTGTLAALKAVVGAGAWLDTPDDLAPYISDFRHLYRGRDAAGALAPHRR